MFPKKYSNLLFILVMGFGMSLLMTLIITYIIQEWIMNMLIVLLKHGQ